MKKLLLLLIGLGMISSSFAQKDTPQQLIEGSKVVLEAIRLFKPDKKKDQPTTEDCTLSICFDNQTEDRIMIFLERLLIEDQNKIEIYSSAGSQDCSYSITTGVYSYEVQSEEGAILRKAEVNLKACRAVLIEVKE